MRRKSSPLACAGARPLEMLELACFCAESQAVGEEGAPAGRGTGPPGRYAVAELQSLQAAVLRRKRHARARMETMQRVQVQLEDWHNHVRLAEVKENFARCALRRVLLGGMMRRVFLVPDKRVSKVALRAGRV